jgi:hypothetical protein
MYLNLRDTSVEFSMVFRRIVRQIAQTDIHHSAGERGTVISLDKVAYLGMVHEPHQGFGRRMDRDRWAHEVSI